MNKVLSTLLILILIVLNISCTEEEIDTVAPVVNILEPVSNKVIDQNFDLIYSIEEQEIDSVSVYLGESFIQSFSNTTSRTSIDVGNISEGKYILKVVGVDISGNTGADSLTVTLDRPDTEPPVILKMIPDDGEIFYDSIKIEIGATDNEGIEGVQLFFNNSLITELKTSPYKFAMDISLYKNGLYELKAVVTDLDGNKTSASREIQVITEPTMEKPIEFSASKGEFWNAISLSWKPVPNANSYEIYRLDDNTQEFILISTVITNEYTDLFSDRQNPLTDIFYKIRAFNSEIEFGHFSELDYGYYTGRTYDVILSFGEEGSDPGEFSFSMQVTVDKADNFYISETSNGTLQKFSPEGVYIENFYSCGTPRAVKFLPNKESLISCSSENVIRIIDENKNTIRQWGSTGSGDSQFQYFRQLTIDNDTVVYIVDTGNSRIQKFDLQGNFLLKWGSEGDGDGQFTNPWGITIYKNMVVVGSGNRLQFFTKQGAFIKSWHFDNTLYDLASDEEHLYVAAGNYVLKIDDEKHFIDKIGEGDFTVVVGLTLKENGDVVAMDTYARKLMVYRKNQ